jgi:hypothetical protein
MSEVELEFRTATVAFAVGEVINVPAEVEALFYAPYFQNRTLVFSSSCTVTIDVGILSVGQSLIFAHIADEGDINFEGEFDVRPPGGSPSISPQGYLEMTYLGDGLFYKKIESNPSEE